MIQWVILGVTLALPLVYLVIHFTYGRKWKMPKGTQVEAEYGDYKATLVYGPGADQYFAYPPKTIALACALGAWSLGSRWNEKRNGRGDSPPKHVVVHVLDDGDYHATYDAPVQKMWPGQPNSNGMLLSVSRRMGNDTLPLVCCRASAFPSTPLTGSLVVHELTHFVGGDRLHTDPAFWAQSETSLEAEASRRYVSKRAQIGIKV